MKANMERQEANNPLWSTLVEEQYDIALTRIADVLLNIDIDTLTEAELKIVEIVTDVRNRVSSLQEMAKSWELTKHGTYKNTEVPTIRK